MFFVPELQGAELLEQVRRQNRVALFEAHLAAHRVQALGVHEGVEIIGGIFHIVEVMLEQRLADELVNEVEGVPGLGDEDVVIHQQQLVGMFAEISFLQSRPGKADHPVAALQRIGAGIDGGGFHVVEEFGIVEGVFADQLFNGVQNRCGVSHAADDFRAGEQFLQSGKSGGPQAVGVENQFPWFIHGGIERLEQAAENGALLLFRQEDRKLIARPHGRKDGPEDMSKRRGHGGVHARVLAQDGRKQGRPRPWQAGDEVEFLRWHDVVFQVEDHLFDRECASGQDRQFACVEVDGVNAGKGGERAGIECSLSAAFNPGLSCAASAGAVDAAISNHKQIPQRQRRRARQRRKLDRRAAAVAVRVVEQCAGGVVVDDPVKHIVGRRADLEHRGGKRAYSCAKRYEHRIVQFDPVDGGNEADDLVLVCGGVWRGVEAVGVLTSIALKIVIAAFAVQDIVA